MSSGRRMWSRRLAGAAWVLLFVVSGCSKGAPPVAKLEASPSELRLAWPEAVEIDVAIEPTAPLPEGVERPILFVHLLDRPGSVVRTFDAPLDATWSVGTRIDVRRRIALSALAGALAPGSYILSVGLYDPAQGRFGVTTSLPRVGRDEFRAATVEVAAPADGVAASFSADWLRAEPVADRQVVATRTLRGGAPGTLTFGPFARPGTIHLTVVVPTADEARARLEPAAPATGSGAAPAAEPPSAPADLSPRVLTASSCGGEPRELAGTGRFEVEFEVGAAGGGCTLSFEPSFLLRREGAHDPISIRLEALSFRPTGGRP